MSFPYPGELVEVKYLEIDEIEVICLVVEHNRVGILNNTEMKVKLEQIGETDLLQIVHIDQSGHITLGRAYHSID